MMRKGKSTSVCLAATVIFSCYLMQTIDCFRFKKTERREGRGEVDAAKTAAFQEGRILFGRVLEKGSGLESQVIDGSKRASSNVSAEDDAAYQADFPGWSPGYMHDAHEREASWRRMSPSLQCGRDQMRFRAMGPGVSQFAVAQGNAPPMPLPEVPSTCGYRMQRNPYGLVMMVPYDGCYMIQEGGNYMLPMRWQGNPVSLWCPKPAVPSYPHMPVPPPSYPHMPPQPPHIKTPDMSNPNFHPSYFYPQYPQYPSHPGPTKAPMTPAVPPQMFQYPYYPMYYPPFTWPPQTTAAPTTPSTATTSAQPTTTQSSTTQTTTKSTTKPPPQLPPYMPFYPPYPPFFPPFVPPFPTLKPETTTTTTTTKAPEPANPTLPPPPAGYPPIPPHYHPHRHNPPFPFMPYPPNYPPPFPRSV